MTISNDNALKISQYWGWGGGGQRTIEVEQTITKVRYA